MKLIFRVIFGMSVMLTTGCSDDRISEPVRSDFNQLLNRILGYHIEGQEENWGGQNISLIDVYQDGLVFKGDNSVDAAFIGFSYGHDDLSMYEVTCQNCASWDIQNDQITLNPRGGTTQIWEIVEVNNEFAIFRQVSNGETFSMKIMN